MSCAVRLTVPTSKPSAVSARGWIVTEVRLVFKRITVTVSYWISFNTRNCLQSLSMPTDNLFCIFLNKDICTFLITGCKIHLPKVLI